MVNVNLLSEVIAHIESDLEHWDQALYRTQSACGTRYCLAGWAITLSFGEQWWDRFSPCFEPDVTYGAVAAELLGLSFVQKEQLFYTTSNIANPDACYLPYNGINPDTAMDAWKEYRQLITDVTGV